MKHYSKRLFGAVESSDLTRIIMAAVLYAATFSQPSSTQVTPSVTLQVDVDNFVVYTYDVTDYLKFATDPNKTTSSLGLQQGGLRTFTPFIGIADIIAVNGASAKGTWLTRGTVLNLQTNPVPGQAVADTIRTNMTEQVFEILRDDGTPIGTILASEVGFGAAPPGAPRAVSETTKPLRAGPERFSELAVKSA